MTVSYCIPLYNKERYIAAVLDAVLAECAATGGEVLVYDDASTDRSPAIVADLAARHPVTMVNSVENRGVVAATATLIGAASQPYLRIVDADDRVMRGSTAHLLDLQHRHDAVLAVGTCGTAHAASPEPDFDAPEFRVETHPIRLLLRNIDFNLSAGIIPAAAARAVLPLPAGMRTSQDLCISLRLAKRGRLVRSEAVTMLQPAEQTNRLSRHVAEMYGDICRVIAEELSAGVSRRDAAYAVRRHAARCARYFRRHAPEKLERIDRALLFRCRLALPIDPITLQADRLRHIAGLFGRDAARVLS